MNRRNLFENRDYCISMPHGELVMKRPNVVSLVKSTDTTLTLVFNEKAEWIPYASNVLCLSDQSSSL